MIRFDLKTFSLLFWLFAELFYFDKGEERSDWKRWVEF